MTDAKLTEAVGHGRSRITMTKSLRDEIREGVNRALKEKYCYWHNRYHPVAEFDDNKKKCRKAEEITAERKKAL